MRRLLSILLLAAFALPIVAPGFARAEDPDAGLPACCRRHGQHHCAMLERAKDTSTHHFVAVCPYFPQHKAAPAVGTNHIVSGAPARVVALSAARLPVAHAETSRRIARERARYKRGPPKGSLAIA